MTHDCRIYILISYTGSPEVGHVWQLRSNHWLFFINGLFNMFFTFLWWTTKEECCLLIYLTCPTNWAVAGDKSEPGRWFLSLPQLTEETLAVARTVAQVHSDVSRWRFCTFLINSAESKGSICIQITSINSLSIRTCEIAYKQTNKQTNKQTDKCMYLNMD